jgi:hypothetical protein
MTANERAVFELGPDSVRFMECLRGARDRHIQLLDSGDHGLLKPPNEAVKEAWIKYFHQDYEMSLEDLLRRKKS